MRKITPLLRLLRLLRLLPLAAAAFASVATSAMLPTLQLSSSTPPPDETAVPASTVLTVDGILEDDDGKGSPTGLGLRTLSGQEIAGTYQRSQLEGGTHFTFTPAAPLAPDSYVLYWVGSPGTYAYFTDPDQERLASAYSSDGSISPIVQFSTVSQPKVRYAYQDARTGTILMSFSEDMDVATLEHVKVLDATGDVLAAPAVWQGGAMHVLELQAPVGGVTIAIEPGLLGKTGVDAASAPFTIEPERR
jgi:hypothetical protein